MLLCVLTELCFALHKLTVSSTFGAHECRFYGLATITTSGFIKWKALLPSSCYHFSIFCQVLCPSEWLWTVNPSCVGVRNIQFSCDWVSCKVVSMSRVTAAERETTRFSTVSNIHNYISKDSLSIVLRKQIIEASNPCCHSKVRVKTGSHSWVSWKWS